MPTETTYLEHYGVKGMRWGVRKSPTQSSSARSARSAKDVGATKMSSLKQGGKNVAKFLKSDMGKITIGTVGYVGFNYLGYRATNGLVETLVREGTRRAPVRALMP